MTRPIHWLALWGCIALSACGGGSDTPSYTQVLEEGALYNPTTRPGGVVEQPGQTAVLGLEADASDLPPASGTPAKGVEDLWFEVQDGQNMPFALDAQTLAGIDRVEVRDAANTLLATLSAAAPSTALNLTPGRYQALVVASAVATAPVPVFARYGQEPDGNAQAQEQGMVRRMDSTARTNRGMWLDGSCVQCDLAGHSYVGWNFSAKSLYSTNFSRADLSGADFFAARLNFADFSAANLSKARFFGASMFAVNLSGATLVGANFFHADLSRANLSGANLSGASFAGANLSDANLTGADLAKAVLFGADLSNARWVDGLRRCAPGSIGVCN